MSEFEQEIKKLVDELPPESRRVVLSGKWEKILREISLKYNLSDTLYQIVSDEIWIVLVGGGDVDLFNESLLESGQFSDILANEISEEVRNRIFIPIIKELEKTQAQNEEENGLDEDWPTTYHIDINEENTEKTSPPENLPVSEEDSDWQQPVRSDFDEQKLNDVFDIKGEEMQTKPETPKTQYQNDPYREPLE